MIARVVSRRIAVIKALTGFVAGFICISVAGWIAPFHKTAIMLILAAVYGLSMVMAGWLAALVVGAILAVVAIALISSGRKKLTYTHPPSHER